MLQKALLHTLVSATKLVINAQFVLTLLFYLYELPPADEEKAPWY